MRPMPHRTLTTEQLTDYLHLLPGDVERLMRESDLPYVVRGGRTLFQRGEVDAWASKRILGMPEKRLDVYHEKTMRGTTEIFPEGKLIPELIQPDYIDLSLSPRTRSSAIREMVALAERTGRVMDARELQQSIEDREALCSTALPGGLALLHARNHADYRFEGSFVVLGRTVQAIPFSAPDCRPTQLFFLICCQDDRIHLHTLARLCLIAHNTHIIPQLLNAADRDEAYKALIEAEQEVLPAPPEETPVHSKRHRNGAG